MNPEQNKKAMNWYSWNINLTLVWPLYDAHSLPNEIPVTAVTPAPSATPSTTTTPSTPTATRMRGARQRDSGRCETLARKGGVRLKNANVKIGVGCVYTNIVNRQL